MERLFARGTRYGYDRARWRGLWRVQIQGYLIAAVQNLQVLPNYKTQSKRGLAFKVDQMKWALNQAIGPVVNGIKELLTPDFMRNVPLRFVNLRYIESGNFRPRAL